MTDVTDAPLAGAEDTAPDRVAIASQWQLTWWAFKKHRLAMIGLWVIGLLYLISLFAEFVAPDNPTKQNRRAVFHPPQMIYFFDTSEDGWSFRPHVQEMDRKRDPDTLAITYEPSDEKIYLTLFGEGPKYKFWGLWTTNIHLLATEKRGISSSFSVPIASVGTCSAESSMAHAFPCRSASSASRSHWYSASRSAVFPAITGGRIDAVIQRLIEFVLSLPTIPIWLALAAALPPSWPIYQQYFVITLIVSLVGWTELGRVVRGRFLAMKNEDFVIAARLDGASEGRIIFRHMLPSLTSHIIASLTLAIPLMILAETALSFLGLGLQPPAISWGVLLKEAQNIRSISQAPWLFIPGGFVVIAVLSFNFLGDGMRDSADPYGH